MSFFVWNKAESEELLGLKKYGWKSLSATSEERFKKIHRFTRKFKLLYLVYRRVDFTIQDDIKKKKSTCRAVCRWVPCSRKRAELGLVNNRKQWLLDLTGEGVSTSMSGRSKSTKVQARLKRWISLYWQQSSVATSPKKKKNGTKEQGQKISPDTTSAKMFVNTELAKRKAQPPLPSG